MIDNIKSLRFGSVPYKIVRGHPVISDENDRVLWGEILQEKQLIKVDSGLAPEMQRIVLLHEVIHGLLNHCGLSGHAEELPERLGYALDAFLQDNPAFVGLYQQEEQSGPIYIGEAFSSDIMRVMGQPDSWTNRWMSQAVGDNSRATFDEERPDKAAAEKLHEAAVDALELMHDGLEKVREIAEMDTRIIGPWLDSAAAGDGSPATFDEDRPDRKAGDP